MSEQDKIALSGYLRKRHSVSKLVVHLVFTTKYRRKLFDDAMIGQLREAFESACVKLECDLLEMNGEADHVRLLIAFPPKLAVSIMVNNLKSVSSRMLRLQNSHLERQSKNAALWSRSYFACTAGGATLDTLKTYIESQTAIE